MAKVDPAAPLEDCMMGIMDWESGSCLYRNDER